MLPRRRSRPIPIAPWRIGASPTAPGPSTTSPGASTARPRPTARQGCLRACASSRAAHRGRQIAENQLVEALARRFQKPHGVPPEEFDAWDDDYAAEMRQVYHDFPDDHDVMALCVEALIMRTLRRLWNVKTGARRSGSDVVEAMAGLRALDPAWRTSGHAAASGDRSPAHPSDGDVDPCRRCACARPTCSGDAVRRMPAT